MRIFSRIVGRVRAIFLCRSHQKCSHIHVPLKNRVIPADAAIQGFKSPSHSNTHCMPKLLLQSFLGFIATSLFILPSFAATSPVGATQGQFKVSESGAANYTIPLSLPPGTAGMQPSLSLSYNSQGGNGLLGMGWSLGGLSSISRCPQTQAQDGVRGAVNFDVNDRFCLDGQRLTVISGVYGAAGAEYRTERESYSRIISYGAAGNGPAYFKVWTKSGQVMEYGVTADAQIEAQGKTSVMVWALNKVQDTVGNYLTVTYTEDNANGQFYPTRIDYTGNSSKGLAPYNSVQFTYETRPDIVPLYVAGSLMKSTMRMTKVQTFTGGALTREYGFAYNQSTATQRSRIGTLTECAGDGVCLMSSNFGWSDTNGTFTAQSAWVHHGTSTAGQMQYADADSDGKADSLYFDTYRGLQVWTGLATGTSFATPSPWITQGTSDPSQIQYADVNGDGRADSLYFDTYRSRQVWVGQSTGTSFGTQSPWVTHGESTPDQMQYADVNGDGRADAIYFDTSRSLGLWVSLSTGAAFTTPQAAVFHGASAPNQIQYADVNGDGQADALYFDVTRSNGVWVSLSNGNNFSAPLQWMQLTGSNAAWQIHYVDVNGDGKADIVYRDNTNGFWVAFSTGNSFTSLVKWVQHGGTFLQGQDQYADVNGDGKVDLIFQGTDNQFWVSLSIGTGFTSPAVWVAYGGSFSIGLARYADVNGDGRVDLVYEGPDPDNTFYASLSSGAFPDLLTTLTTGLGSVTNITYKPITDPTIYTKEPGSTYPTLDIQAPIYVVASSNTSNGIGGSYALNYKYSGMKASQDGRGMLGFRSMETTDPQTGIVTLNEYRQDYPYTGLPSLSTKKLNGTLLNQAQNTYTAVSLGGTRHSVQLTQSVESSYELNGSLVTTVTTTNQYDSFGNPTQIVVSTGDGYSKTTTNTYTNDTTNWLLGRLTLASVTSATPSAGTLTRTSSFAYHATTGLLTQEVIEPNSPALRLSTDYSYDGYGNKLSVTVSGSGIASRTTSSIYDSRGQFPTTTTNALGHSDTGAYDARFGKAASLTGPNNLTTTWAYDGFGRKINETRADATQTNITYNLCDATCPNFAQYYVSSSTLGSPTSYAYYDMLNREIRVQTQGFDGRLITKDTYYDSFGRVDRVTKPYYAGDSPLYSYLAYDALGRVIQETAPDNSTKQINYNGLTTTVTNALGQTETKTKNSQGQLVSVTDNLGNLISYQYDPFGNLTQTTDPKGNQTTLTYDARGRKIAMQDPDMGSWTYTYNVLGELIQQKDAKNQIVNMTYDLLGRMLTRSEPDLNSTWVYDSATKGIGKLKQVSSDNGFLRVYTYDTLGRVASETSTIDTTYNVVKTYDAYGRVSVLTYPTGFAVKNVYNAYGYLAEVRNNANNALFWQANAKDADGHTLNETLGNGLTTIRTYTNTTGRIANIAVGPNGSVQNQSVMFDALGNLIYRYDPAQAQSETFSYDGLNRLTTTTKGSTTTTVAYDSIGNITNKSDVGAYTYGAKPHAVTQVTGTTNATYAYDANGNLISGAGRTVTLTSYNLPSNITQGANSVNFIYDADHTRIKQTSATQISIYLNPRIDVGMHFEKEVKGGVTEYKHYIYGAAGVVGVYTTSSAASPGSPSSSPKMRYFHQDHLGSIVAVTDDAAVVVARYAFDPWGKRLVLAGDADATHHGFTGHEHLSDVGLIHMNGRVYDPVLGRFMSADPYIQAPDNLQSYNRYSYVWNNPLSATDPSGYFKLGKFLKKNIGTIINIAATMMGCPMCGAIISSAVSTIQNKGNFGDFLKGMAINFVAGQIAGPIAGGITGGLGLNPGDFLTAVFRGALAGGIGGGLTSMAYGGSFADGFRGGAISGGITAGIIWGYRANLTNQVIGRTDFDRHAGDRSAFGNGVDFDGRGPVDRFIAANGKYDVTLQELRDYGQSPTGAETFRNLINSGERLSINAQDLQPEAAIGGNSINYSGGLGAQAFAHEFSHTKFGGSYTDYVGQFGMPNKALAVEMQNRYHTWNGLSLRPLQYIEFGTSVVRPVDMFSTSQRFWRPW